MQQEQLEKCSGLPVCTKHQYLWAAPSLGTNQIKWSNQEESPRVGGTLKEDIRVHRRHFGMPLYRDSSNSIPTWLQKEERSFLAHLQRERSQKVLQWLGSYFCLQFCCFQHLKRAGKGLGLFPECLFDGPLPRWCFLHYLVWCPTLSIPTLRLATASSQWAYLRVPLSATVSC